MQKISRILTPILPVFLAVACQPPAEEMAPARTAMEVEADFDALRAEWQNMANADDAAGVATFYTEDAVLTDVTGMTFSGPAAIAEYFTEFFAEASDLTIETTGYVIHGDMVAAYGTFSETAMGPEGAMPMTGMWQTVSMYQPDGSVKIRLHQNMLPAQMGPPM